MRHPFSITVFCLAINRHSRPLPCGRYSHAMLAEDEVHTLGQVGGKQRVDVVGTLKSFFYCGAKINNRCFAEKLACANTSWLR